jgi:hypothetical protein
LDAEDTEYVRREDVMMMVSGSAFRGDIQQMKNGVLSMLWMAMQQAISGDQLDALIWIMDMRDRESVKLCRREVGQLLGYAIVYKRRSITLRLCGLSPGFTNDRDEYDRDDLFMDVVSIPDDWDDVLLAILQADAITIVEAMVWSIIRGNRRLVDTLSLKVRDRDWLRIYEQGGKYYYLQDREDIIAQSLLLEVLSKCESSSVVCCFFRPMCEKGLNIIAYHINWRHVFREACEKLILEVIRYCYDKISTEDKVEMYHNSRECRLFIREDLTLVSHTHKKQRL